MEKIVVRNNYLPFENLWAMRSKDIFKSIWQEKSLIVSDDVDKAQIVILTSPFDEGVIKNAGRRGAYWGPQAIINVLKKMIIPANVSSIYEYKTDTTILDEQHDLLVAKKIDQLLKTSKIVHLGGGHDKVLPVLSGLEQHLLKENQKLKLTILNFDPHLDTRTDNEPHSGNPFRLFDSRAICDFNLIQIGTHPHANAPSNYSPLKKGEMQIIDFHTLESESKNFTLSGEKFFNDHLKDKIGDFLLISIDADVFLSSEVEAVSAVNNKGIPVHYLSQILNVIKEQIKNPTLLGIYEYNPLYDNLSQKGARALAQIVYDLA